MGEGKPVKVSVVIPSFNAEKIIGKTIQSVIDQSFEDWELIVVDDCSNDGTRDIVNSYVEQDPRIRLIALDMNNGAPAVPRNIGIKAAHGRWIALLDADDIWHPKKLEYQLSALEEYAATFCSTQMLDFSDESEILFTEPGSVNIEKISYFKQRVKGRTPTSSVIAERSLLLEFPFNEDPRYKAVEDYHCWLRIHKSQGDSIKLSYPFLFYRRTDSQISRSKVSQLGRVFMVHKELLGGALWGALFFSFTHVLGAIYYRVLKRGL